MPQDNAAKVALSVFEVALLGRLRTLALRAGQADLAAFPCSAGCVEPLVELIERGPTPLGVWVAGQRVV